MEVISAKKDSVFNRIGAQPKQMNRVCKYWLQGRCTNISCRFMHRLPPPQQMNQSHVSKPRVWKNPDNCNPKSGTSYPKTQQKASTKILPVVKSEPEINEAPTEILTVVKSEPEKNEAPPKPCQYTKLTELQGHTQGITGIALPAGCDKLYTCSKDKSLRAWDCNSGQFVGSVSTDGEVGCLITEGAWVFVGLPNLVKAWNIQNQAEFSVNAPAGLVCSLVVDDDKLFAGMEDGAILVWKLHTETNIPEPIVMLKEHNGAVCSLVVGANNRLYSGSKDSTIKVWDRQKLQCLQTLSGHTRDVTAVICWDKFLISASLDKTLKVWYATESGTIEVAYETKDDYELKALCGIHDAEAKPILLCSYSDKTVRLYELPSFTERGRIHSKGEVEVIEVGEVGGVNGGLFFTGDANGDVSVWKMQ